MKVLLFGATGMVGQGVLRECLLDPDVTEVLAVGRSRTGQQHAKLREVVVADVSNFSSIEPDLAGFDACFFCLGVSSVGMNERDYRRITFDLTMAVARTLAPRNPQMTFVYVSGMSTDSSEHGRVMWARVKGETENALLTLPFKQAVMFRPGYIQPPHAVTSKTARYRAVYVVLGWLYPLLKRIAPSYVTTTEQIGRAMLIVAKHGAPKPILESADISEIGSA